MEELTIDQKRALAIAAARMRAAQDSNWEGSSNQAPREFSVAQTLKNVPGSAWNLAKSLAGAAIHPLDTATGVLDLGAGALRNVAPSGLREAVDKLDPYPEAAQRASGVASQASDFYKKRCGGIENIAQTVQEDPVGVAADVSTVLGFGSALAPGKVRHALGTASRYTNPLTALSPAAKLTGKAAKNLLGLTTGVGPESVAQAAKAGYTGDKSFTRNLSGQEPITNILDDAKRGIENMRRQKSADYRTNMAGVVGDKTVLSFKGIDKAISDAESTVSYKGQVKNVRAAQAVQSMADDVSAWKALDPKEFHTPEGLDALKQKLGSTLESIPFEERTARLAAGKVYNAIKTEIEKQAPVYAKTMKGYADASEQITEIERALSLGDRASKDTAIRKLQSLARNNVNTNYGNRLDMAKTLEAEGGVNLLPSIAGQAMNSWTARGLGGQAENIAALGSAGFHNPTIALALPFQSPKAVGATTYGLGRTAGATGGLLGRSGVTADRARLAALLAAQAEPDW